MNFKRLTEHQILYIYNRVISTQIEYKIQLTIFNAEEFLKMSAPFRKLLKKKTHLVNTLPNYMIYTHQGYNMKSLYDTQLEAQSSFLQQQLNNESILGIVSKIRIAQLQSRLWLPYSLIYNWNIPSKKNRYKNNLIATTLSLLYENDITIQPHNNTKNTILGGTIPLIDIFGDDYYQTKVYIKLREKGIMFLSQVSSSADSHLLNYTDLKYRPFLARLNKVPYWFYYLESKVLMSKDTSRQLLPQWNTFQNVDYKSFITYPNMDKKFVHEWIAVFDNVKSEAILGKAIKKDNNTKHNCRTLGSSIG